VQERGPAEAAGRKAALWVLHEDANQLQHGGGEVAPETHQQRHFALPGEQEAGHLHQQPVHGNQARGHHPQTQELMMHH